ncbi:tail fiber protein [Lacfervirus LFP01]|uniref:Tail fiber protein n=1 Tax=Lactobacillus phage LFP01 TaxID=3051505 RepID=A0AAX3XG84_9CAUD
MLYRQIILEWGQDTESGVWGLGYSPDNGKNFYVLNTTHGRKYRAEDGNRLYPYISDQVQDKIETVVAPAKSAADSAVSYANDAIKKSRVNSQAIAAQSEAISEAKSAMDSATAEIQQAIANAASDAANIRADVAQVQNEVNTAKAANSTSVEALKSDVSATKQDLADVHDSLTKAQAAAEDSQKAIDKSIAQINDSVATTNKDLEGVRNDLTKAQSDITANKKSVNDNIAQINSDIEQDRKDIASAQQANADTAKQLDTYSKQAQDQGKTIKSIQDKQDGFTATLADVQGNVTQVSDKVDGLSASLKDAQGNVASVKAQADQLSATLTDHAKSITTLTASAKEVSSTLEEADGRLSKVEQTAKTNSSTLSDVQGDLSQVKQDATTLTSTLKDAKGNISTLQQKANSVSAQLASAQGDITSLQTDVKGIKATLVSHEGDIHTLQADSKTLKDDMQDAQGNISTLQKTSTDVTSELQDHTGRISKVEQTASTLTNEFSDQQGHLSKVEQTATGTQQTVANQQGQINNIQTDVSGVHETITGQGNQIAKINVTLNGLDTKYEGVSGDLNNLKSQSQWVTVTSPVDLNNVITPCHEFLKGAVTNAPNERAWWYLTVEGSEGDRITQTVIADQSNNRYTRRLAGSWSAWVRDATQTDVTTLSNRITTNSTQITQNKQAIALKADQSTVYKLSGEVSQNTAQLKVQADQISSKVSSSDFKTLNDKVNGAISSIQKNSTAIDQTNKQISLKADQTEVDQVKQTATQNSSRLDVMDGQIRSRVTSTDVNNIVDSKGFATTNTVQSLVTQKADEWNLNLTTLKTDVNAIKTTGGGVNLLTGTAKCEFTFGPNLGTQTVQKYDDETNYIQFTSNTPIDFMGPWVQWTPEVGQTYTLSADVCGNGYIQGWKFHYEGGGSNSLDRVDLTNDWQRISNTFRVNTINGNWAMYADNSTLLKVKHIKIEKGTVAHDWSPAPSDMATVTSVTNLSATVDGIKSTVATKADQSYVTQLSNVIATKVSQGEYNSRITQLKDDINLQVKKGDVISQINQEAGGNTLIQVSDGMGSLILDAKTTVFTGEAFIPSAAISSIQADKIKIGSASLFSDDGTLNLINQNAGTASIKLTYGIMEGYSQPLTQFSNGTNAHALEVGQHGINVTPTIFFNDYPDEAKDTGWVGFSRHQTNGEVIFHTYDDSKELFRVVCAARFNHDLHIDQTLWQQGLSIASGNTIWSGSDFLAIGDHISNGYTNVMARSFSQQSTLSAKTNIETVDPKDALNLINQTDIRSYQYKSDVAQGKAKRYTSLIIDDVNDVSQYRAPDEFTNEERTGRDDGSAVGYLFLAVKELTRRIKILEDKLHG